MLEFLEECDQPGIGILETAGIDELDAFADTVVVDTVIVQPLTNRRPATFSIVADYLIVNVTAAMSVLCKAIVAQSDIVTALTQPFHLIVYFFRNTTMFGKAMIY